jgi:myosin-1
VNEEFGSSADAESCSCSSNKTISGFFPDGVAVNEASKRMVSTATAFKTSLNELTQLLLIKNPHYVRCIKPNDKLAAGVFDRELCKHQVRYLGLLENVRVRRAGFVFRQDYEKFLFRYRVLCPRLWPTYSGPAREAVDLIFKQMKISADNYRLGNFFSGRS